jgi:hypothetical protein
MAAKNLPIIMRTSIGVARYFGKSDAWARLAFKWGAIPTEFLIEGRQPAITDATLKRLSTEITLKGLSAGNSK